MRKIAKPLGHDLRDADTQTVVQEEEEKQPQAELAFHSAVESQSFAPAEIPLQWESAGKKLPVGFTVCKTIGLEQKQMRIELKVLASDQCQYFTIKCPDDMAVSASSTILEEAFMKFCSILRNLGRTAVDVSTPLDNVTVGDFFSL
jgi:hypothetical protein